MPRRPRICPAGTCFHVINRAVARLTLFEKQKDCETFERVLALAHASRATGPSKLTSTLQLGWPRLIAQIDRGW